MSTLLYSLLANDRAMARDIERHKIWHAVFGIALILLGMAGMSHAVLMSVISMHLLGFLFLMTGLGEILFSISSGNLNRFFLNLFLGILNLAVAWIMLMNPGISLLALTWILAAYFIVTGAYKMIASAIERGRGWNWAFISGIVSLILGGCTWKGWPATGAWVPGLFVGVNLLATGFSILLILAAVTHQESKI